jgi:hypothetical protein
MSFYRPVSEIPNRPSPRNQERSAPGPGTGRCFGGVRFRWDAFVLVRHGEIGSEPGESLVAVGAPEDACVLEGFHIGEVCRLSKPYRCKNPRVRHISIESAGPGAPRHGMTTKLGEECFKAVIQSACRGVSAPVGARQRAAAICGKNCHPDTGSIALLSSASNVGVDRAAFFASVGRSGWRHSTRKRAKWEWLPVQLRRSCSKWRPRFCRSTHTRSGLAQAIIMAARARPVGSF